MNKPKERSDFPEYTEQLESEVRRRVARDPEMLRKDLDRRKIPYGLQVFFMFSFIHHIEEFHLRLSALRLLRRVVNDYIIQIVFQGRDMRWDEQKKSSEKVKRDIATGLAVDVAELVRRIDRLLSDMEKLSLDEWRGLFPEQTQVNPALERASYMENALRLLYRLPFWAERSYPMLKKLLFDSDPRVGAKVIPLMRRLAQGREAEVLTLFEAAKERYVGEEGSFEPLDYSRRLQLVSLGIKELAPFGAETVRETAPNETVADAEPVE